MTVTVDFTGRMEPPSTPSSVSIQRHWPCVGCGYDLFGQPRDGRCPECGAEASQTVERLGWIEDDARLRATRDLPAPLFYSALFSGLSVGAAVWFAVSGPGAILVGLLFAGLLVGAVWNELRWVTLLARTQDGFDAPERGSFRDRKYAFSTIGLLVAAAILMPINDDVGTLVAAFAFGTMALGAHRHVRNYGRLSKLARDIHAKPLAVFSNALGTFKAVFETVWLGCIAITGASIGFDVDSGFVVITALGALFGAMLYAGVWIAQMIVAGRLSTQLTAFLERESIVATSSPWIAASEKMP